MCHFLAKTVVALLTLWSVLFSFAVCWLLHLLLVSFFSLIWLSVFLVPSLVAVPRALFFDQEDQLHLVGQDAHAALEMDVCAVLLHV